MWKLYTVSLVVDRLVAGIPAHGAPLDAWLEASGEKVKQQPLAEAAGVGDAPASSAAVAEDVRDMLAESDIEELHSVVFYRHDGAPVFESRNVKAALKEAANILKDGLGIRNARARLAEQVFVTPRFIPLDAAVQVGERPITVMTMRGPRSSLKRFEYMEEVRLAFELKVLEAPAGKFTEEQLRTMFEYLQDGGIGADRSQGNGTFTLDYLRAR